MNNSLNILDEISNLLAYHRSYVEVFLQTHNTILRGDGPLSYEYRYIIAIIATGRHQCCCLMNFLKNEFLNHGGDERWLQGLEAIPKKLHKIYHINKILAHRPWLLSTTDIENLKEGEDNWSLSELVHGIIILVHFHALSTFVFSCGLHTKLKAILPTLVNNENDARWPTSPPPAAAENPCSSSEAINRVRSGQILRVPPSPPSVVGTQRIKVATLVKRMVNIASKKYNSEITQEELSKRFEIIEQQSAELSVAPQRRNSMLDTDIGLFIDDPSFIYQDFTKRGQSNGTHTFRIQDYSWEDHGYSLVNSLYNEVGNLLDVKFKTTYNLTYGTMGELSQVDTSRFRLAIWNYIQCLYGIKHDDYDYNEVNQLLERSLKTYIKNAVCYPERVTKKDYDCVMTEFKDSEKIHIILLFLEARMQAELLYALRTMMRFVT